MKIKKLINYRVGIFILIFFIQSAIYACPKCNQDFYKELMEQRGNTLGGQELLEAIKNQTVPGQPQPPVLPASYNSETDIKQPDMNQPDNINEDTINSSSSPVSYYIYLIIFENLTFI